MRLATGVLPERLGGCVLPASQNPYLIYDQKDFPYPTYDLTKNSIPCLYPVSDLSYN